MVYRAIVHKLDLTPPARQSLQYRDSSEITSRTRLRSDFGFFFRSSHTAYAQKLTRRIRQSSHGGLIRAHTLRARQSSSPQSCWISHRGLVSAHTADSPDLIQRARQSSHLRHTRSHTEGSWRAHTSVSPDLIQRTRQSSHLRLIRFYHRHVSSELILRARRRLVCVRRT